MPHQKWSDYALFVTFFPHLIAGPLLHHRSMMTQFTRPETFRFGRINLINGMAYFWLGLAKKVLIADYLAVFADQTFGAARDGLELGFVDAWIGMLAFSLQLYFDFPGYSDMAIGLALMFNVALPLNFNAPLRATSIIEFWRRWHMSLSAFLRDNVYIPLGGNRRGELRRNANVMATMLLGGLWHGAGWTFVLWGGMHGLFLTVNHAWRRLGLARRFGGTAPTTGLAWALTFLSVTLAWVPFRADSLHSAGRIYRGVFGLNGMGLPEPLGALLPALGQLFGESTAAAIVGGGTVTGMLEAVVMLGLALAIVLCLPNLQRMTPAWRTWCLVPSFALALQRVAASSAPSPFLYFQF